MKVPVRYNKSNNTVRIKAESTKFIPDYVNYLFQYLKIPNNAKIIFTDRTIKGGVKEWLKEYHLL